MNSQKLDFSTHTATWLTLAMIPLSLIIVLFAPDSWGYENGIIENLQLAILTLALLYCVSARADKSLYLFFATVLLFMIFREVNCGRVLLWSRSGEIFHCGPPADYLKWKEIPHGSAIRATIYTVLTLLCIAALCRKGNLRALLSIIFRTRIPVWEGLLFIIGIVTGIIAEKYSISFLLEEMAETLAYTALAAALYRYSRALQAPALP